MNVEANPSKSPSLEDQLTRMRKMTEEVNQLLRSSSQGLSPEVNYSLNQLASSLSGISRQITQELEEKSNLIELANIGQVINSSLDPNEVLRIVMDTIIRLTGAERGFLMLRDENGELTTYIARNWEQESLDPSEFEISRTVINRVAAAGQPLLTTNAQEDPRFDGQESIIAYNLRSILCVPLKVKDEITGVIYADNRVRTGLFSETDRDRLTAFANQAAVAIRVCAPHSGRSDRAEKPDGQRLRVDRQWSDHSRRGRQDHPDQFRRRINPGEKPGRLDRSPDQRNARIFFRQRIPPS